MARSPGTDPAEDLAEFAAAAPGDVLGNRFELRRLLGGGRVSDVFAAWDREAKGEVAVRMLRPLLAADPVMRDRFFRAANAFVAAEHAGLLRVHGVFEEGERCFAAMELLPGVSLADEMRSRPASAGGYPLEDGRKAAGVLCDALARLHAFSAHGSVRPENIRVGAHGEVKLLDAGLVPAPGECVAWPPGILSEALWMAPEVLQGRPLEPRSDQWSLAAILFRMLSLEAPAGRAPPLRALRPEIPEGLGWAVDRALSARPADRFPTMGEFGEALRSPPGAGLRLLRTLRSALSGPRPGRGPAGPGPG